MAQLSLLVLMEEGGLGLGKLFYAANMILNDN